MAAETNQPSDGINPPTLPYIVGAGAGYALLLALGRARSNLDMVSGEAGLQSASEATSTSPLAPEAIDGLIRDARQDPSTLGPEDWQDLMAACPDKFSEGGEFYAA
ncbi:MAG: hypothetical protein V4702_00680 [Patescibacteria group bacterium]